jgi:acetylglutamate kinase
VTTQPDPKARPVVVKLGGSTLGAHDTSLRDIAAAHDAGTPMVVVHGGGAIVNEWLARAGIEARFVRGLRVTDERSLEVVVAVLAGLVNKQIVAELAALGARVVGMSGADGGLLRARRFDDELGYVGRIEQVDARAVEELLRAGYVPVVAPIALGDDGGLLNTNADTAAGEIAAALGARTLVFLTDVAGVKDEHGAVRERLTAAQAQAMIESGVATGGMIPKLEAACSAALAGCETRIVDGTREGALRAALGGDAGGTAVSAE